MTEVLSEFSHELDDESRRAATLPSSLEAFEALNHSSDYTDAVSLIEAGIKQSIRHGYRDIKVVTNDNVRLTLGEFLASDLYKLKVTPEERRAILDKYLPVAKVIAATPLSLNGGADNEWSPTARLSVHRPLDGKELGAGERPEEYEDEE